MQKGRHGLYIIPVVCQGYILPFRTLYGCIYTNKAWCILFVSLLWLWKATNPKRTEVKAPAFFMSVNECVKGNSTIRVLLWGLIKQWHTKALICFVE